MHTFDVIQSALEHPLSAKTNTVTVEVIAPPPPPVEEPIVEVAPVDPEIIILNNKPMFDGFLEG